MSILKYFKNTPGRPPRATGPKCNFFFFKFATRSLAKKGSVAHPTGDRSLSPTPGATGACRPLGGRQPPLFFYSRDFVANLKKIAFEPCRPP